MEKKMCIIKCKIYSAETCCCWEVYIFIFQEVLHAGKELPCVCVIACQMKTQQAGKQRTLNGMSREGCRILPR